MLYAAYVLGFFMSFVFVKVVCDRCRNRPLPGAVLRHDSRAIVHRVEFGGLAISLWEHQILATGL